MKVRFHACAEDSLLKFAVIIARHGGRYVLCKHRQRNTWEFPGGHREPGEEILAAARRELLEETGALRYRIAPVCAYSVAGSNTVNPEGNETYGMLYAAEIETFAPELHSEIERIALFDVLPDNWTYPEIQPLLLQEYQRWQKQHFA